MEFEWRKHDWRRYDLKDNPFTDQAFINIWANDRRLNGRLFCEEIVTKEMGKLMSLIVRKPNLIFVYSPRVVKGTGKSALMAAAYWKLYDAKQNVVWAEATGGYSTSPTLGRIIDSMVAEGVFDNMKEAIGEISYSRIRDMLKASYRIPLPSLVGALVRILEMGPEDTAKKFANIRRSIRVSSATEVFGYVVALMEACKLGRLIVFIDQFEEFVRSHRGYAALDRLGNDINDLFRATLGRASLVVSMHPEAFEIFGKAASEYIPEIVQIGEERTVTLGPFESDDAIRLAAYYLGKYKIEGSEKPELYPFEESVLRYIHLKTQKNPRPFIISLHNALIEGAMEEHVSIDENFIKDTTNHQRVLIGAENEWQEFKDGKLVLEQ
ncbi:hypothetical protein KAU88_02520 [Candidatus Bathyarchaeota archaeon]|nr:hypothetical protein [Candidatus Bathyarchaeota archaeon]